MTEWTDNDTALLRRCVGYADGWDAHTSFGNLIIDKRGSDFVIQALIDALRCQLERQYVDAIYAEALTDGGWQVQIIPKGTCERSDWFEAETISEAALTAIDEFMRGQVIEQQEDGDD